MITTSKKINQLLMTLALTITFMDQLYQVLGFKSEVHLMSKIFLKNHNYLKQLPELHMRDSKKRTLRHLKKQMKSSNCTLTPNGQQKNLNTLLWNAQLWLMISSTGAAVGSQTGTLLIYHGLIKVASLKISLIMNSMRRT